MKRRRWTRDDAIRALQAHAERTGRTATCRQLHPPLPTQGTLERLFGSVNGAMRAAGLPTRGVGRPRLSGRPPTAESFHSEPVLRKADRAA